MPLFKVGSHSKAVNKVKIFFILKKYVVWLVFNNAYMLPQRFKIELCRPFGAYSLSDSLLRRFPPTLIYFAPSRQVGINLSLPLIKNLGQLVYHYLNNLGQLVYHCLIFSLYLLALLSQFLFLNPSIIADC